MSRLELGVAQPVELGGRSRPQMIAALLTKLGPELEKRYGWGRSYAPIFDESGRPIGFRPCDEQRARPPVPGRPAGPRSGGTAADLRRRRAQAEMEAKVGLRPSGTSLFERMIYTHALAARWTRGAADQ